MNDHLNKLHDALLRMPLVAILRGLPVSRAAEMGATLANAGLTVLEVPLNSPEPLRSIRILRDTLGDRAVVGAGTVLSVDQVKQVAEAGGQIVVAPSTNTSVIDACLREGMVPIPGFATATEAFRAIDAGAQYLKLFPADSYPPSFIGAISAVLPEVVKVIAVGGITNDTILDYLAAGYFAVGIGGYLYKPGYEPDRVEGIANVLVATCQTWRTSFQPKVTL